MREIAALRTTVKFLRERTGWFRPDIEERLKSKEDRTESALKTILRDLEQSKSEIDRLTTTLKEYAEGELLQASLASLKSTEWVVDGRECISSCLHCGFRELKGHAVDCSVFGEDGIFSKSNKIAAGQ